MTGHQPSSPAERPRPTATIHYIGNPYNPPLMAIIAQVLQHMKAAGQRLAPN